MKKILFICTGNTCRSAMAEAFFKSLVSQRSLDELLSCKSAGIAASPGSSASKNTIQIMNEEHNIDLKEHYSSSLTSELVDNFDIILVMTQNQKEFLMFKYPQSIDKTYTLKEYSYKKTNSGVANISKYDISDPYRMPLQVYSQCAVEIKDSIVRLVDLLIE